ncbi:hypothetical protein TNCT_322901 [Trichonephila clavata]|uniref:Uncharacterized protein n=1 Tax=Trichonephila clavata TaxID=2740835 RepID=A0A8X6HDK7_TRICU|nr:hypothetical protein TNCT_322901 [Trichonephila clavata]
MQSPEVSTVMTHRPISSYKIALPSIYPPSHNQQPLQPPQSFLSSLTKQTFMTDENYALELTSMDQSAMLVTRTHCGQVCPIMMRTTLRWMAFEFVYRENSMLP